VRREHIAELEPTAAATLSVRRGIGGVVRASSQCAAARSTPATTALLG
jgi:hypothetical protein